MKKLRTLLSVSLFCGLYSISFAASVPPPSSNQLTNQAVAGLKKDQAAGTSTNKTPKAKPGTALKTKKPIQTVKPHMPLSPKTQTLVKTYQANIKKQTKDDTQYQKDVTAASALMGQVKNGKPTLAQAQALQKLQAQIAADQTKHKTDQQTTAKQLADVKAQVAALKTDQAKEQTAGKESASSSQAQNKGVASANVPLTGQSSMQKSQNASQQGFDIQALVQIVNNSTAASASHLSTTASQGQDVSIGDMSSMQMFMNKLSQASEMSSSVINASNSSIRSMAQTVSR